MPDEKGIIHTVAVLLAGLSRDWQIDQGYDPTKIYGGPETVAGQFRIYPGVWPKHIALALDRQLHDEVKRAYEPIYNGSK